MTNPPKRNLSDPGEMFPDDEDDLLDGDDEEGDDEGDAEAPARKAPGMPADDEDWTGEDEEDDRTGDWDRSDPPDESERREDEAQSARVRSHVTGLFHREQATGPMIRLVGLSLR